MSALLPLTLAWLLALGGRALRRAAGPVDRDPALDLAAGMVALHLLLFSSSIAGVPWRPFAALVPAALLLIAWPRERAARPASRGLAISGGRLGVGDVVALGAVTWFAALAHGRWVTAADFIYHWGAKARQFALADGIDWGYLANGGNWRIHPDYPTLWPELLAVTARLLGSSDEAVLLLWSPLLLVALLVAARNALAASAVPRLVAQPALATLGLLLATFGIGQEMAGAADWLVALAGVLALPALLAPRDRDGDLRIAVAAALAASSKIEGVPFAAILVAAHLLGREARWFGLPRWRSVLRTALPTAAVVLPWWIQCSRHHLFLATNTGRFDLERSAAIWPAVFQVVTATTWLGAPFLLLALPAGLASARHRRLAAVLLAQLTFYFWVYYTGPVDTRFYVLASLPRLLLHLIPAAALGLVVMLSSRQRERAAEVGP